MTSHQSKVPPVAAEYFARYYGEAIEVDGRLLRLRTEHPVIAQVFHPESGWRRYPWRKRVSGAEVAKLRAAGVTHVALRSEGHTADFSVRELSRR